MENGIESAMLNSLTLFQKAIDEHDNLEIICYETTDEGKDMLVIENNRVLPNVEGHQTTVDVVELFGKITDEDEAFNFVRVVNNDRDKIVLHGVTRIVGYYSRTHNWNKSKIGELRDRQNGYYASTGMQEVKKYKKEALVAVDNLG
jgi:hypothetical protein